MKEQKKYVRSLHAHLVHLKFPRFHYSPRLVQAGNFNLFPVIFLRELFGGFDYFAYFCSVNIIYSLKLKCV